MIEKITLDILTQDSVSVKKQQYVEQNGQHYVIGKPHRKTYVNTINGRIEVENEVLEPYKSVIFMIWGNEPTVSDVSP